MFQLAIYFWTTMPEPLFNPITSHVVHLRNVHYQSYMFENEVIVFMLLLGKAGFWLYAGSVRFIQEISFRSVRLVVIAMKTNYILEQQFLC